MITENIDRHDEKQLYDLSASDSVKSFDLLMESLSMKPSDKVNVPAEAADNEESYVALPPFIFSETKKRNGVTQTQNRISLPLLANYIRSATFYFFARDGAKSGINRFLYGNGVYQHISDEELQGLIKDTITDVDVTLLKMSEVREVYQNLITDRKFIDNSSLNEDESIINFRNGLLSLDTMTLRPHTPNVYTTIQLPCDWNSTPPPTPVFDAFLKTFTDGDTDVASLLLQYMGACLSNIKGHRMKKALFIYGPGDTGKSQLKRLTELLLGETNCASIDLYKLEERFGTSTLYNKRLAGASDMSFVKIREMNVFKQATGGDSIHCEFKGEKAFDFVYNGLFWNCMNGLPKFAGDRGDWVYDRIIPIEAKNIITKPDKHLLDKMYQEREGIVYKAVMELLKVIQNDYNFSIPASATLAKQKYQTTNNTVRSFLATCCERRKSVQSPQVNDPATTKRIFDAYVSWCKDSNNGFHETISEFRDEAERYYDVYGDDLIIRNSKNRYYIFTLTEETLRDYGFIK